MHPLDRPIWSALNSRQAPLDIGGPQARRFPFDISPLAAAADASAEAAAALSALIPAGDDVSLLEPVVWPAPEGVEARVAGTCLQMIAPAFTAGGAKDLAILPLGDADAAEMLELALLTRPGPFRARTYKLGRFIGVRENGTLIAMAGERLHTQGFREISAVCTHPDCRGRGLGGTLMRAVGARILADGETPFLHVYDHNTTAIALYRSLGFEVRFAVEHVIWKKA